MSDVLLATSFFLKNDTKQIKKMRPYAPLGPLLAATSLRNLGYSVSVFDAMLSEGEEEFKARLDEDRPGMVGRFGTLLGNHNVNIARMEVGRQRRRGQAMIILALDEPVPDPLLAKLKKDKGVQWVVQIQLKQLH